MGPIDGVPGTNTYKVLQSLASRGGYTGPIDGIPGPNTYAGLANLLD
jgi:peptidoglycan hydrolase-like protein with peptidoglycan-binding domain